MGLALSAGCTSHSECRNRSSVGGAGALRVGKTQISTTRAVEWHVNSRVGGYLDGRSYLSITSSSRTTWECWFDAPSPSTKSYSSSRATMSRWQDSLSGNFQEGTRTGPVLEKTSRTAPWRSTRSFWSLSIQSWWSRSWLMTEGREVRARPACCYTSPWKLTLEYGTTTPVVLCGVLPEVIRVH